MKWKNVNKDTVFIEDESYLVAVYHDEQPLLARYSNGVLYESSYKTEIKIQDCYAYMKLNIPKRSKIKKHLHELNSNIYSVSIEDKDKREEVIHETTISFIEKYLRHEHNDIYAIVTTGNVCNYYLCNHHKNYKENSENIIMTLIPKYALLQEQS